MNICIVIPCYNESGRMPVEEILYDIEKYEFNYCLVNDGSKDNTLEILNDIATKFPDQIKVVDQQPNQGKAQAVRRGVLEALSWKKFDYIGFMDADMATPTSEIQMLLDIAVTKGKKMVVGSRLKRMGVEIDRKVSRHLAGRLIATMISNILALPTYDTQCGAKIFEGNIAKELFKEEFISKWLFDVELFFRAKLIFKDEIYQMVYEQPLNKWLEKGDSKVSMWFFFKIPFEMFKMKRKYR